MTALKARAHNVKRYKESLKGQTHSSNLVLFVLWLGFDEELKECNGAITNRWFQIEHLQIDGIR